MIDLATPQHVLRPQGVGPKQMDLTRPPINYSCPCGRRETLVVPNHPGALVWRCVQCGKNRKVTFVVHDEKDGGDGFVSLQSKPLLHECSTCALQDFIALPGGGGEMRWECSCGSVWMLEFTPGKAKLAKVVRR